VRALDTKGASRAHPVQLEVIGTIGAGSVFSGRVGPMQAVRIMTGAQIPEGCDAVIMLEAAKEIARGGQSYIQIQRSVDQGDNISFTGEGTTKGSVLVHNGAYIDPGAVASPATFGYTTVPVRNQPILDVI